MLIVLPYTRFYVYSKITNFLEKFKRKMGNECKSCNSCQKAEITNEVKHEESAGKKE
jgi:hypothetical protein